MTLGHGKRVSDSNFSIYKNKCVPVQWRGKEGIHTCAYMRVHVHAHTYTLHLCGRTKLVELVISFFIRWVLMTQPRYSGFCSKHLIYISSLSNFIFWDIIMYLWLYWTFEIDHAVLGLTKNYQPLSPQLHFNF